jgi:hypothetical protein
MLPLGTCHGARFLAWTPQLADWRLDVPQLSSPVISPAAPYKMRYVKYFQL